MILKIRICRPKESGSTRTQNADKLLQLFWHWRDYLWGWYWWCRLEAPSRQTPGRSRHIFNWIISSPIILIREKFSALMLYGIILKQYINLIDYFDRLNGWIRGQSILYVTSFSLTIKIWIHRKCCLHLSLWIIRL